MDRDLVIIGAGGFAREAYCWINDQYQVRAFYSSLGAVQDCMFGVPIVRNFDGLSGHRFLVAIGDPKIKKYLWHEAMTAGLKPCSPIVHPTAIIGKKNTLMPGSIVCPGVIITTNVYIGDGVILNIGVTVGHDSGIEDFVTVSPGANISGNVSIGESSYIGTGALIREKISIGSECTIGMGAVVVKNVLRRTTVVGNPARPIKAE